MVSVSLTQYTYQVFFLKKQVDRIEKIKNK